MIELSLAGPIEMPDKVSSGKIMFREFTHNKNIEGGFSGLELLEVEGKSFGKFSVGCPELLGVVSLPLDYCFNQFPPQVTKQPDYWYGKATLLDYITGNFKEIVNHEPLAFATLLLIVSFWLSDKLWKIGKIICHNLFWL
jgi:hypothetical protein